MTQYLAIDKDSCVLYGVGRPDPDDFVGPPTPKPDDTEDVRHRAWQGQLILSAAPTPTSVLRFEDESSGPLWNETASLNDLAATALAMIDAAADTARLSVSPPGRDLEYARAEAQAQAYKDAAYTGDVPPCVDSWARAKQWSARNSAIDILSTAALWYSALDQIRDLRLNAKEAVRRVTGASADIDAIVSQFQTDLTTLMKGLQ
jgi:hypothetical protein